MKKLSVMFIGLSMTAFSVMAQTATTSHTTHTTTVQQNPDGSTNTKITHRRHVVVHPTKRAPRTIQTTKHTTTTTTTNAPAQ